MQSEHSARNMSMQTAKANGKAGTVSTISAEKKEKRMFQAANTERQNSGFKASVFFCCL